MEPKPNSQNILVLGYGNPGRLDDGLGPKLVEWLAERNIPNVTVESDYQLNVEDAERIAKHDVVIFVDAAVKGEEPFFFNPLTPKESITFTTHSIQPDSLLALAHALFGSSSLGFILGIRGYEFNDFGERLSEQALSNLEQAKIFIESCLREQKFDTASVPTEKIETVC